MEEDFHKRLTQLEIELAQVKRELAQLKSSQVKSEDLHKKDLKTSFSELFMSEEAKERARREQGLEITRPVEAIKPKPSVVAPTITPTEPAQQVAAPEPVKPVKEKLSFEQLVNRTLPKIFMFILVLGVLWGLKLMSDYGFLTDAAKLVLAFALSVALGFAAYALEQKGKISPVVGITLYAASFITGILTIAAGAIMYELIPLTLALIFALVYIAYGVFLSYWKGNEVLTIFVILTSLLIPYLLEYMDFNLYIILIYIVLLFAVVQPVIWEHRQLIALYVGVFLSQLALMITSNLDFDALPFPIGVAAILAIFLVSYFKLFHADERFKKLKHSVLLSLFLFSLLGMSITTNGDDGYLIGQGMLLMIVIASLVYAWPKKMHMTKDILLSVGFIYIMSMIFTLSDSYLTTRLLLMTTVFISLVLAMRIQASFMQVFYSFIFFVIGLFVLFDNEYKPFFNLSNATALLYIAMFIVLYILMREPKGNPTALQKGLDKLFFPQFVQTAIFAAGLVYVIGLEDTYFLTVHEPILSWLYVLLVFVAVLLFIPWKNAQIFTFFTVVSFGIVVLSQLINDTEYPEMSLLGFFVRLLFIIVLIAILFDIWMKGLIYKKYPMLFASKLDFATMIFLTVQLVMVFGLMEYAVVHRILDWKMAVVFNTASIFLAAIVAIVLAAKGMLGKLRLFGVALLLIGIIKLIFNDLSSLDLLVRSILFIVIGGVGLVISNRLLTKSEK